MKNNEQKAKIFLVQEASKISADALIGDSQDKNISKHWFLSSNGLHGILTLIILIFAPFSITLIPMNNALFQPFYWYESMFSTFSFFLFSTLCAFDGVEATLEPFKSNSWFTHNVKRFRNGYLMPYAPFLVQYFGLPWTCSIQTNHILLSWISGSRHTTLVLNPKGSTCGSSDEAKM